jgi:hypothetical protein
VKPEEGRLTGRSGSRWETINVNFKKTGIQCEVNGEFKMNSSLGPVMGCCEHGNEHSTSIKKQTIS